MKKSTIISAILSVFIIMPISIYLQYWILSQLHPDRLIWFLFIIYIPVAIIVTIVNKMSEESD